MVWPFNGSYDEALICVFDGHGLHGEKVSEWCVHTVTEKLSQDEEALAADPAALLFKVRHPCPWVDVVLCSSLGVVSPCVRSCEYLVPHAADHCRDGPTVTGIT